jgi:hypothetical protein
VKTEEDLEETVQVVGLLLTQARAERDEARAMLEKVALELDAEGYSGWAEGIIDACYWLEETK